jgi:hypothetical protein
MAKTAKFLLDLKAWSDEDTDTNDPRMNDFRWYEQLTGIEFDVCSNLSYAIAADADLVVQMPAATGKYIFLRSDQEVAVKFNGETAETNVVTPTTAGTTSDGILFQKIDFTSLTLTNLSSTEIANVTVFIGGDNA